MLSYSLLLICCIYTVVGTLPSQCSKSSYYEIWDEWKRASKYETGTDDKTFCDAALMEGWFRFSLNGRPGQVDIPDRIHAPNDSWNCNTLYPIYLDADDPYPKAVGDNVEVPTCVLVNQTETCYKPANLKPINITNCGSFNVYYLTQPPESCPIAYCAGSNVIQPITTTPASTTPPMSSTSPTPTIPPVPVPPVLPTVSISDEELVIVFTGLNPRIKAISGQWVVRTYKNSKEIIHKQEIQLQVTQSSLPIKHRFPISQLKYDSISGTVELKASYNGQHFGKWMRSSFYKGPGLDDSPKNRMERHGSKHHHTATIVGIVVAGVVLIALIIGVTAYFIRRKGPIKSVTPEKPISEAPPPYTTHGNPRA